MGQTSCGHTKEEPLITLTTREPFISDREERVHEQKKVPRLRLPKKPSITELVLSPPARVNSENVTYVYNYYVHRHYHHHPTKNIYIPNTNETTQSTSGYKITERRL